MTRYAPPATRERAITLREQHGWTIAAIAAELGYSQGAVGWWLLCAGAEHPSRVPQATYVPATRHRGGIAVHPYTAEEDALILALQCQGYGGTAIARILTQRWPHRPRKHNSVLGRLMTLARREERALANTERRQRARTAVDGATRQASA